MSGKANGGREALRVGVVGVGVMGSNHARVFVDLPGVNLAGIENVNSLVQRVLYLRPVPDLLFALLPVIIAWIRFR